MTIELTYLSWTLVLALVQIALVASLRTREVGLTWLSGPRDGTPPKPAGKITARLYRAQNNLLETLPVFIAAVLILQATGIHTPKTHLAVMLYFWGRAAYVPLYGLGFRYVRTLVWAASIAGIVMLLCAAYCGK